ALAYYPAAAKAAGVEGEASIRCARDAHLALKDCALVSESPAGHGFGAAALAMAAASPENPKVTTDAAALGAPQTIAVRFSLHPPAVRPDIAETAHMMTPAKLLHGPTPAQVQAAYPVRALSDQVEGVAAMDCAVTKAGALTACHVAGESPAGYGFGQAALDLAPDFALKPATMDGQPVAGGEVRVPVPFGRDPTAPLTLPGGGG
ncbi:MAG: energy transducer TonB, partial [Caulobacteraceae bacterium]